LVEAAHQRGSSLWVAGIAAEGREAMIGIGR
jgi:hypothetical protein